MTIRGIAIGLLVATAIGAFCFFFDRVIRQGALISHQMPTIVYGGIVFVLLCVNPLLRRLRERWVFTRREFAVVCAFALLAGSVASWGLWQFLPSSIMLPQHHARTRPGWAHEKVIELPPERMLPDVSEDEDTVLTGYVTGRSRGVKHISLGEVPWHAWWRPLLFWVPLGLSITLAVVGLAVVVHVQWARHELLAYPISAFAHSMLPDEGQMWGPVFRSRLFWLGGATVFLVHMNNYMYGWFPNALVPVPLTLDFSALSPLFPTLMAGDGWALLRPAIIFTIIGLAYFLPSDVSFSMGVMPFVFCYFYGLLASYGISLHYGDHMSTRIEAFLFLGGYFAVLLMVLYGGRHYYLGILRRSVGLKSPGDADTSAVWAMRVFLAGTVLFVVQLVVVGLDWQLAVLYTAIALMVWIVVSRVVAESGAVEVGTQVFPGAVLWALFGGVALGPKMLVTMLLVSTVILAGPGWATMPFAVQAFKLGDMSDVRVGRLAKWAMVTVVLCTLVCIPAQIYWQYDVGGLSTSRGWPMAVSQFAFDNGVRVKQQLAGQETLELSESLSGWSRFAHMRPNWPCVAAFFVAVGLALAFGVMRLKFPRWPLHPVVFVFLGGWQARRMAFPFLLGWLIKAGVGKYGGARVYNDLKPLMVGIIAGELLARLAGMAAGLLYLALSGSSPPGSGFY